MKISQKAPFLVSGGGGGGNNHRWNQSPALPPRGIARWKGETLPPTHNQSSFCFCILGFCHVVQIAVGRCEFSFESLNRLLQPKWGLIQEKYEQITRQLLQNLGSCLWHWCKSILTAQLSENMQALLFSPVKYQAPLEDNTWDTIQETQLVSNSFRLWSL